ncbi:hypothetical protein PMAYCL1PPCAC_22550 [Pristionchus mayeri]|uniref:Protein kinase domain-containing protein n=1 Tax=Pristionchus mayeri TaxID=1317129 RepID=A0AAN5CXN4_9BILA|nr:hypothetical protein PMAYCL1PPCAC_22550 [Pristionchus mayeri]
MSLERAFETFRSHNEFLDLAHFTQFSSDIANGLRFVHSNGYFHGDLKPANVLLHNYGMAKVADFGLSQAPITRGTAVNGHRGTPRYMAPEQYTDQKLDLEAMQRCDVWSYGVVLWKMMTCREPLAHVEDHRLALVIGTNDDKSHPSLPSECSAEALVNLLLSCWSSKSLYRPTFYKITTEILNDIKRQNELDFKMPELWMEECEKWAEAASIKH